MANKVSVRELEHFMVGNGVTEIVEDAPRVLSKAESRVMAEQIYDEWFQYIKDMQGWELIGGAGMSLFPWTTTSLDEVQQSRDKYVRESRILVRREPHAMNAVRMYSSYGATTRVEFKPRDDQAGMIWNEKFWELPENRPILGAHRRRRLDLRLLSDGELFFVLFGMPDGAVRVRLIDPLEIAESLVTHPEDGDKVLYYKRNVPQRVSGGIISTEARSVYYRDVYATDEDLASARRAGLKLDEQSTIARANGKEVLVYHVPFQPLGLRGNGLLFAAISYIKTLRNFFQDRATIVRGLSTYIRTVTAKGGSKAIGDLATTMRSSIAAGLGYETNPPDAVGATWLENAMLTKKDTPPMTNAGNAMSDARIFRQPIAAAVGITEANLTGDPSVGNLASQVQMEGPQLRNFQDYQRTWKAVWLDLYNIVLDYNNFTGNRGVDIDFPPVILEPFGEFINIVMAANEKGFVPWEESARQILMRMGANRVDDLIEALKEEKKEREEKAQQIAQGQGPPQPEEEGGNGRRPAGREGKRSPPSGVPKQPPMFEVDLSEHGESVEGECPLCEEDGCVYEVHGVRFCAHCQMTFNPKFVRGRKKVAEVAAETLTEGWSPPRGKRVRRKRRKSRGQPPN